MKSTAEILQTLREIENDSNPTHFQDAIAQFLRTKNRTPEQDIELLKDLLTQIKNSEYGNKRKTIDIIRQFVEVEIEEPSYEIRFK